MIVTFIKNMVPGEGLGLEGLMGFCEPAVMVTNEVNIRNIVYKFYWKIYDEWISYLDLLNMNCKANCDNLISALVHHT